MIEFDDWFPEALDRIGASVDLKEAYVALCQGRIGEVSVKNIELLQKELAIAVKFSLKTNSMFARNNIVKTDVQRVVAENERLKQRYQEAGAELRRRETEFVEAIGVTSDEFRRRVLEACRDLPTPPLTSAKNVEVAAMGIPYLLYKMRPNDAPARLDETFGAKGNLADAEKISELCNAILESGPDADRHARLKTYHATAVKLIAGDDRSLIADIYSFLTTWHKCAYARLEIGHRLAASLCVTDIAGIEHDVRMPWPAWSLVVPDGLLGDQVARIWVLDNVVSHDGPRIRATTVLDRHGRHPDVLSSVTREMIASLVVGSALAMSNPEDFRKEHQHRPSARSSKGRKGGAPDLDQARYMLSAPVSIDLRDHIQEALDEERSGKRRGSSPKVQFLVRGHWRRQACGAGLTERRTIWIQPFWKGPEESRVLLRAHKVEDR